MIIDHERKTVQLTADDFDAAIFQLCHNPSQPVYIGTIPRGYVVTMPPTITPDCKITIGLSHKPDVPWPDEDDKEPDLS